MVRVACCAARTTAVPGQTIATGARFTTSVIAASNRIDLKLAIDHKIDTVDKDVFTYRLLSTIQEICEAPMPVSWTDLLIAFEFVSAGNAGMHQVFLSKQTGKLYWHSGSSDELDELPDDIDDDEKYVQLPDKRELDLGRALVFDFVRQFLPHDFSEVQRIFARRGAYAKFKDLLARRGALDQWYDFESKAEERALRSWCDLNSIEITDEN